MTMPNYSVSRLLKRSAAAALLSSWFCAVLPAQQTPPAAPPKTKPALPPAPDEEEITPSRKQDNDQPINSAKPSNPLVLKQPDGRGNQSDQFDEKGRRLEPQTPVRKKNFGDFQGRHSTDPRTRSLNDDEDLAYFGYSFFEPARNYLLAKQQYVQRLLSGDNPPSSEENRNPQQNFSRMRNDGASSSDPRTRSSSTASRRKAYGQTNNGSDDSLLSRRRVKPGKGRAGVSGEDTPAGESASASMDTEDTVVIPGTGAGSRRRSRTLSSENLDPALKLPRGRKSTDDANPDPRDPRSPQRERPQNSPPDENDPADSENTGPVRGFGAKTSRRGSSDFGVFDDTNAFNSIADPLAQLRGNVLASVPTTYSLSGGDKLILTYRTPTLSDTELRLTVDPQGAITLPEAGRIVVSGLTLAQAQAAIQRKLGLLYRNVSTQVTLEELRTIVVTVSGEAFQPGSYPVPSVTSAINVLYAAGGPTERGSLRRIEVRRQGRLAGTIDVYKFLTGGEQPDIPLQSGDLITIPPRQSEITVRGEVRNPAIYELKDNETLADALRFSGGIKPSGVSQNIRIETLVPGRERVLKTVDLKTTSAARGVALFDGDNVDVFSVRDTVANKVTVEGAVDQPSDYAFTPGMHVADLVDRARGLLPEAYTPRAELYRWNPDNTTTLIPVNLDAALTRSSASNLLLSRWDRLRIYTREEVAWTGTRRVELTGAVQRPGVYQRSEGMRLSDLLRRAGGPTPDAYLNRAVVLHQRGDGTFAYEYPNLLSAIKGTNGSDVLIEDNDLVAVYKTDEANFTPERVVSIRGEIVAPGVYPRGDGMKLSDLIKNAGGFRPGATPRVTIAHARSFVDVPNTEVKTVSISVNDRGIPAQDLLLDDGDVVTVQGDGNFQNEVRLVTVKGFVNRPGPIVLSRKGMRLSDAILEAGGLKPEGSPEGTEFNRDPKMLASTGQKTIMQKVSALSDLINASVYRRELAKSDIERAKALKTAETEGAGLLGSLTGAGTPAPVPSNPIVAQNLANRDLVSRPRTMGETDLTPNGNIAVNLPQALRKPGSEEDILLVDGDVITIPEMPTTLQVSGAVVNPRGVLFKSGAGLDYYITRAGGFAPDVAKDRIVVIRAGGGIFPASKAGALRPGDLIFVPTKVVAEKITANSNLLNDLFRGITNTALSVLLATKLFGL